MPAEHKQQGAAPIRGMGAWRQRLVCEGPAAGQHAPGKHATMLFSSGLMSVHFASKNLPCSSWGHNQR